METFQAFLDTGLNFFWPMKGLLRNR